MHARLRQRYVHDLVTDISGLSGARFEQFGYLLLDSLAPEVDWLHRGTNLQGAPVSGVVDSVDRTGRVVGQASSESEYFSGQLEKIRHDVSQARQNHTQVETIWLLSNRRMGPTATTAVTNVVADYQKSKLTVQVRDAQAIADHILGKLRSASFVEGLMGFLPMLGRLQNEWAASHRIPAYPTYVRRPRQEDQVHKLLTTNRYVSVVGISGTGKSALCSQVAQDMRDDFELVFWVDASQLGGIEELRSHDVWGNGERYNLLGQLKTSATLLILDDVKQPFPKASLLDKDAHPGSVVLLTSQFKQDDQYLLTDLSESEAKEVLGLVSGSICPPEAFNAVWRACGGHPLLLSLMAAIAADEGWAVVLQECAVPTQLEDDGRQLVSDRILARHAHVLQREIAFISWLDTPRIDESLMRGTCGPVSIRNLGKHHFLAATDNGLLRIHDVVFQSAKAAASKFPELDFADDVATVLENLAKDDVALAQCARNHVALLHRLLEESSEPASVRFALASQWSQRIRHELLGDPLKQAALLNATDPPIATWAIVESIEAIYQATSRHSRDDATDGLKEHLRAFSILEQVNAERPDMLRDLRHHRGKVLKWLGETAAAEACFRELVQADPHFAAGRLQLARILANDPTRRGEASSELNRILQAAESAPTSVSRNVLLATFELVGRNELAEFAADIVAEHLELLRRAVLETSPFSGEQALAALTRLATAVRYERPDVLERILPLLPEVDLACASEGLRFDLAQLKKLRAKSELSGVLGLEPPKWSEQATSLLAEAATLYEGMVGGHKFRAVQHAENLILQGRPNEALRVLRDVPIADRSHFWRQREAQALRETGDATSALNAINAALDDNCGKFRSAYLYTRWQVRVALGDPMSCTDLDEAIACCDNEKFRNDLQELRVRSAESDVDLLRGD